MYLYTPVYPYEDGYNLALLEAMATGMPVAALTHATSPVRDEIEGVLASNGEVLRERICSLLDNPAEARKMGEAARARIEGEFAISRFKNTWQSFALRLIRDQSRRVGD